MTDEINVFSFYRQTITCAYYCVLLKLLYL